MKTSELEDFEPSSPKTGNVLRGLFGFLFVFIIGFAGFRFISKLRKAPQKKAAIQALSVKVQTQTIQKKDLFLSLKGYGTAQAYKSLELVPEVSGILTSVFEPFKPGSYVKKGTSFFRVEQTMYSLEYNRLKTQIQSLKKQIQIAQNALKVSRSNLGRSKRLVKKRALDYSSLEKAQQAFMGQEQQLEALKQQSAVNTILLQKASVNLYKTKIKAPFHGRITKGNLTKGTFVSQGRSVGIFESIEAVEFPVAFPLEQVRKMAKEDGTPVLLKDASTFLQKLPPVQIKAGKKIWNGRVERIGSTIDLATRTLTFYIKVTFTKEEMGELLPGTFASIRVPVRQLREAISLPNEALYEQKYIFVVKNGKLEKRKVQVLYSDSERFILTGGVENGENVVTTQMTDPVDGTPVFVGK